MRETAEAVIVGGGCMGASVAYHLARLGIAGVVLLEREAQLGTGSTGRNAGGFRHQFSHAANIALSKESIALFARFEDEVGYPIDVWPDGYLFLLSSPASVDAFRRNVALQLAHGIRVEWLSAAEAAGLYAGLDTRGVLAATFCPDDGIADPNGVTAGFARAAQARGVEIRRAAEVVAIDRAPGGSLIVHTGAGRIETPTVVNAGGPWARGIGRMAGVDVPVDPERRHIFIAQSPRDLPATRLMVIDFESTFYFHREGAGLLFGMGDPDETTGFDTTVRWDFLPQVIEAAVRRLPALADAAISHAWAGLYEMTPDHNPIIGPAPDLPGFYTCAGFSGHGFQHSPAAGRIVADLIAGRDPGLDVTPFAHGRFSRAGQRAELNVV